MKDSPEQRIKLAVLIAQQFAGIDGGHHKTWVIDQMIRSLLGEKEYQIFVRNYESGEDGPVTYMWDEGIPP